MTPMIGQLCEFGAEREIFKLKSVDNGHYYAGSGALCTPIYGHPYAHKGGACPVPEGLECSLTLRDGTKVHTMNIADISNGLDIIWQHSREGCASPRDVIFVEFIKVLEGYKL